MFSGLLLQRDKAAGWRAAQLCLPLKEPEQPSVINSYFSTVMLNNTALHTQVKFDEKELFKSLEMLIASLFQVFVLSLSLSLSLLFSFFPSTLSPLSPGLLPKCNDLRTSLKFIGSHFFTSCEVFYSHTCHSPVRHSVISLSRRNCKILQYPLRSTCCVCNDLAIKIRQLLYTKGSGDTWQVFIKTQTSFY
jgi:hypothetical protein